MQLWRNYYLGTQALIFVIDSADRKRIEDARKELIRIINDPEMKHAVLLVLANKMDVEGRMDLYDITEALGLKKLEGGRSWHVEATCALTGEGLLEGKHH